MGQARGRLRGRKEGLQRGGGPPPPGPSPEGSFEERVRLLQERALSYLEKEMDVLLGGTGNRKPVLEVLRGLGALRSSKPGDPAPDDDAGPRARWSLAESLGRGEAPSEAEGGSA